MKHMTPSLDILTKAARENRDRLTEQELERIQEQFNGKAKKEFAHLGGSLEDRVALLMAIDGIENPDQRKAAFAAIKLPDGMASENVLAGPSNAELDNLAKAHQRANPSLTIEAAHAAVLKTPIGKRLYAKTLN